MVATNQKNSLWESNLEREQNTNDLPITVRKQGPSTPLDNDLHLRATGKGRKLAWQGDGHETQKVAQV
jgi:hypothetical protein